MIQLKQTHHHTLCCSHKLTPGGKADSDYCKQNITLNFFNLGRESGIFSPSLVAMLEDEL